ncbi:uncharacterized protein LOC143215513 [Lasioglossum baleicum]|uniref:uncharacterized protein LOC143215513 n=1 Tax=Lasioglossum baleicum TaxID=434251 RepID=UPI003FCE05F4
MIATFEPRRTSRLFVLLLAAILIEFAAAAPPIDVRIPCRESETCIDLSAFANATCKNGFCECSTAAGVKNCTLSEIRRPTHRNSGVLVVHTCKLPQDCTFNNSICNTTNSQCECQKEYVWSADRKSCLKKAEAMQSVCEEDKQCTVFLANTTCRNGKCSCIEGTHYTGNACYKTIALNNTCTQSEECATVDGAICTDREVCDCKAGTVINAAGNTCLPVAKQFLDNCVEDKQCSMTFQEDAVCVDGICRCRDQHHFDQELNRCFIDRGLGDDCAIAQECYHASKENGTSVGLRCSMNKCVCAEDYQEEGDACIANEATESGPSLLSLSLTVPLLLFML